MIILYLAHTWNQMLQCEKMFLRRYTFLCMLCMTPTILFASSSLSFSFHSLQQAQIFNLKVKIQLRKFSILYSLITFPWVEYKFFSCPILRPFYFKQLYIMLLFCPHFDFTHWPSLDTLSPFISHTIQCAFSILNVLSHFHSHFVGTLPRKHVQSQVIFSKEFFPETTS